MLVPVYASFSRRALARLIDLCVVLTPCGLLYLANGALGFPLRYTALFNWQWPESPTMFMTYDFPGFFVIFAAVKLFIAYPYFALMESGHRQATLGKLATGIKVTDLDGHRISFGRATGRYFLKSVSAAEFMLGYLVSFSDQQQTWHDYVARTLVLRRNIFPSLYVLPRIPSRWMFAVPFFPRSVSNEAAAQYECLWCDHRSLEKHARCPGCGSVGYASVGALRGLLLMNGVIFTIIGLFVSYLSWSVISDRWRDDQLSRTGTPIGLIFILCLTSILLVGGGFSSLLGKRWLLRLMLTMVRISGKLPRN
jgi:uncharacterized RDD family membrane protein YckC/uncharacterized membrane protein YhaH (DUF805 family)